MVTNEESVCLVGVQAVAVFVDSASVCSLLMHIHVFDTGQVPKPLCVTVP